MGKLDPRLENIFAQAMDIADVKQRAAFIGHECAGDEALRREVEALLQADHGAGNFMKATQVVGQAGAIPSEQAGDHIGRYKLLEQIGEGGFGVVWMAEQEEPVRRRVALKIIKLGMDTRQVVARFEAERQALAMMDHPNIARIFDGGATETGRPYFVMELVRGVRITDYCDANKLSTRDRLALFIQVCQAVQHAHQKGIIHRDLKPSNILVTEQDGKPVPKVIDFGVAKATQARLTERTLFTGLHQRIGTPAYMSPEQAGLGALDVDTRSDIYALGVLLYELVTGRTPFTKEEFEQAGLDEIFRLIREQDPPKPSTRLSTLTRVELTTIATQRQAEPAKLNKLLRGDLDWIVMKALEKDRGRRYETANGLALDLRRHLGSEPVLARPAGTAYRLRKLARRNTLAFAAATAVVVALVAGLGLATIGLLQARIQRDRAVVANRLAQRNLYAADVSLAQTALEEGNLGRARKLLERQQSKPGQTDLRGFEWHYFWNLCQGEQLHALAGHSNAVTCVVYSPDGKTLASGSSDDTVKLWNVGNRQVTATLSHGGHVLCIAFSPDGQFLATGGADGLVRFWDLGTRTVQFTIEETAIRMAFSPAATLLAIGRGRPGDDLGSVMLWDYAARKKVNTFSNAGPNVAFSPDGKILASGSCNRAITLRDVASGQKIRTLQNAVQVLALTFSPDGRTLASGNWAGDLQFWDVSTGQRMAELQRHPAHVRSVAFSPDGRTLATGNEDDTILLWSVTTRKELATFRGHGAPVMAVVFSPDGKTLASGSADQALMLWNAIPKEKPERIADVVSPPVFSPDGNLMAGTCRDNQVRFWTVATGHAAFVLSGERLAVAFSPDGKTLLTVGRDYSIQRWDVASQTLRTSTRLARNKEPVKSATISPDGKILATFGNWEDEVTLWDTATGEVISTLAGHQDAVRQVEFSPDGRTLASASHDQTARIWDAATHNELAILTGHKGVVRCLAFSPDGKVLATGSYDNTVKLWNVSSREELATLTGHRGAVFGLAFSPDGRTLAAGSGDGNVKLWNIATHREVATLSQWRTARLAAFFSPEGQDLVTIKAVESVVFSSTGKTLASVDSDGLVHFWNAPTQ